MIQHERIMGSSISSRLQIVQQLKHSWWRMNYLGKYKVDSNRSADIPTRKMYIKLVESVRQMGAKVLVFSCLHTCKKWVDGMGSGWTAFSVDWCCCYPSLRNARIGRRSRRRKGSKTTGSKSRLNKKFIDDKQGLKIWLNRSKFQVFLDQPNIKFFQQGVFCVDC